MKLGALLGLALAVAAISVVALAHPDHEGKGGHKHDHDKDKARQPTDAQKEKRLERVIRRAETRLRNRPQRIKDRRKFLRKRLGRHLRGGELTPALVAELRDHARRTAFIRQIRYISAKKKDYETVVAADKVLSKENARHERWWRTTLRKARAKK